MLELPPVSTEEPAEPPWGRALLPAAPPDEEVPAVGPTVVPAVGVLLEPAVEVPLPPVAGGFVFRSSAVGPSTEHPAATRAGNTKKAKVAPYIEEVRIGTAFRAGYSELFIGDSPTC